MCFLMLLVYNSAVLTVKWKGLISSFQHIIHGISISMFSSDMIMFMLQDIEEDRLCSICYAQVKCVQFQPCGHQSCRSVDF